MPQIPNNPNNKRVNIIHKDEPDTTVRLEDGTIIKIRTVVFGIIAVYNEDGTRTLHEDGSPLYGVNSQQMMFVDTFEAVPENVKRN